MKYIRVAAFSLLLFSFLLPLFAETLTTEELLPLEETNADEELLNEELPINEEELLIVEESIPEQESLLVIYDEDLESFFFDAPDLVVERAPFIFEPRSLAQIFPNLTRSQRRVATGNRGLRHYFTSGGSPIIIPASDSGIDIFNSVMKKNPSHIVETLIIFPYNGRELDMLDLYNVLGRVSSIKDQMLIVRDRPFQVFTDSTRIESAQVRRPIPDPPFADTLPYSETLFIRLTEITIGELFIRGNISFSLYGLTYSMTNFRDVYFFIFRVMREERFSMYIYLEPVKEGVLVYSMSGIYLPDFIANRINMDVSINNRITVITSWIAEGLMLQETVRPRIPFAQ
ncbi:MAG: hypothetical protein LBC80_01460 [Treponema sp.]|jgi:hypothetical protein|nr:hypothetical protein [Treponema sp.]